MNDFFNVIMLAALQGVAEFLPISSSGHLVLGRSLLGLGDAGLRLDVFLHVGTLVAVFAFYRATVSRLLRGLFAAEKAARRAAWTFAGKLALSSVPVGVVGLLFNDAIAETTPRVVGVGLLVTGALLCATRVLPRGDRDVSWGRALAMGLAQALAIVPGISRSGTTLAAARAVRVDAEASAEFSFLMSAPPIMGAALLEIMRSGDAAAAPDVAWGLCIVGAALAAIVGYFALKLLVATLKSRAFWLFGPYCLIVGALAL